MTLYEITSDYMNLMELAAQDDVDETAIQDTFEALDGTFEDKADGYAKVLAELDSETKAIAEEIKRLQARKGALEMSSMRLKDSLMQAMQKTGKTKFKTPLFSFGIQKNPTSVQITDESKIPKEYLIPQEPKIDRKSILEQMKEGKTFKWATMEQTERLSIR